VRAERHQERLESTAPVAAASGATCVSIYIDTHTYVYIHTQTKRMQGEETGSAVGLEDGGYGCDDESESDMVCLVERVREVCSKKKDRWTLEQSNYMGLGPTT
jgi:hypothetical protein